MKKLSRITAVFLAVLIMLPQLAIPAHADCTCGREEPDYGAGFTTEVIGTNVGDVMTYAKCKICGQWFPYCGPEGSGAVYEHRWKQGDVAYPTCTSDGYFVITCQDCGATWREVTDKATGHDWGPPMPVIWPSCTSGGAQSRICNNCGETEVISLPPLGHSWGAWTVIQKPSCTEDGVEQHTCEACHATETRHIPATKHQWGDWKLTKTPTPTEPGEEERECTVCHEKETRSVEATGVYAKKGESDFRVLVAKELMKDDEKFDGTIDEKLDDAFSAALTDFQKSMKAEDTSGDLTIETLDALIIGYAERYGSKIPAEGPMQQFPSGLLSYAELDSTYKSNKDGTHERSSVYKGIRFVLYSDEFSYPLPEKLTAAQDPVHESCLTGNGEKTCPCGWIELLSLETAIGDIKGFTEFGSMVLLDGLSDETEEGLYTILEFDYEDYLGEYLHWEKVPNAASYHLELSVFNEEKHDWESVHTADVKEEILFLTGLPDGDYFASLTALGENGDPVSYEACGGFMRYGTESVKSKMPAPQHLSALMLTALTWDYPQVVKAPLFEVRLAAYQGDSSNPVWSTQKVTADTFVDFTAEFAKHGAFEPGTYFKASVTAMDPKGIAAASDPAEAEPFNWIPRDYYLARQPVNVRAGAGRNFDRIGGLSAGDFVTAFGSETGEDGASYIRILYGADYGYVNTAFLDWFVPKDFTVNVDLDNGTTITVETLASGAIDMSDFLSQVRKPDNGRIGWRLFRFNYQGEEVKETDVLKPGMTLETVWERDTAYVWVRLHDDGKEKEVPVEIGGTLTEVPSDAYSVWMTGPDGTGSIVTESTRFTKDLNELYSARFKGSDVMLGSYANTCPELLHKMYDTPSYSGKVVGTLQRGDRIRILETTVQDRIQWYKVYSYRLDAEGYVVEYLLNAAETVSRTLHFDAAGGSCLVKSITVKAKYEQYDRKYHYRADSYPVPSRDGYVFMGWADASGNEYTTETEITEADVYLKAVWENSQPYGVRIGVTTLDFDADEEAPYYYEDVTYEKVPFHSAIKLPLLGETDYWYRSEYGGKTIWIEKRFIMTSFRELVVHDKTRNSAYILETWKEISCMAVADMYNGGRVYVIGQKKNSYKVIFNCVDKNIRGQREEFKGVEWGWLRFRFENVYRNYMEDELHHFSNTVVFNAGHGYCDTAYRTYGSYLPDELPVARCPGYQFQGWFTDPIGGLQVFGGQRMDSGTLYAHYENQYEGRIQAAVQTTDAYYKRTGAVPYIKSGVEVEPGTVVVVTERDEKNGMFSANYGGNTYWFRITDFTFGRQLTTTHVEYKTDRYIRSKSNGKGKEYRKVVCPEAFVMVAEEKGYYIVVFPESATGFAFLSKRHFY
ncbi:MAG: InlB B-repeat-containing protein [Lachnospiraceae bacterium]|nr:InlB B-repeat-containing protein [Lachnospiraceae bacterium]